MIDGQFGLQIAIVFNIIQKKALISNLLTKHPVWCWFSLSLFLPLAHSNSNNYFFHAKFLFIYLNKACKVCSTSVSDRTRSEFLEHRGFN